LNIIAVLAQEFEVSSSCNW